MNLMDSFRGMVTWWMEPPRELSVDADSAIDILQRIAHTSDRPWRLPSVNEALGVPAINRAVSLISSTTGMLSVMGVRNGSIMDEPPMLLSRPDPFHSPGEFYGGTAASMAKYGEFVWWIASRDTDGKAAALLLVPLNELQVDENRRNRMFPRYRWGNVESTRYSPAHPEGQFVHRLYPLADPFDLRGRGPLQICGAATSVTVEAQEWAADFYAEGGYPNINLHDPADLTDDEAEKLRAQWVKTPPNTPQVTSGQIEVREVPVNVQGAQMLNARQHQNGDAARMFGIPGSLLEYQSPGASLTYQNLEGEFTKLVRTCLMPLYLEPIEQAMSDLLPRSTVARFNVKGFMRADTLTRFKVHGIAIDKGIYDADYAQREEGILSGDVEWAAVPPAPPAAVPTQIPRRASLDVASEVRCPKGHLLAELASPPYRFTCFRCKSTVAA